LLNDEYYAEELIINKAGYNKPYEISHNNVIFDMVNNISKTPYKINIALLEFIQLGRRGEEFKILISEHFDNDLKGLENKTRDHINKHEK